MLKRKRKQLAEHALLRAVFDNIKPTALRSLEDIRKGVEKTGKLRAEGSKPLSIYERYHLNVFQGLSSILKTCDRIEECRKYIHHFPSPRTFEKKGINQYAWIEYHYSYYLVLVVSIFDIALIAVNRVFHLGNTERNCKPEVIMSNAFVSGTKVQTALRALDNFVRPFRGLRHLHVHRGERPQLGSIIGSELLDNLEIFSFVNSLPSNSKKLLTPEFLDFAFKGETRKIVTRMEEDFYHLYDRVAQLLDALKPVYDVISPKIK